MLSAATMPQSMIIQKRVAKNATAKEIPRKPSDRKVARIYTAQPIIKMRPAKAITGVMPGIFVMAQW